MGSLNGMNILIFHWKNVCVALRRPLSINGMNISLYPKYATFGPKVCILCSLVSLVQHSCHDDGRQGIHKNIDVSLEMCVWRQYTDICHIWYSLTFCHHYGSKMKTCNFSAKIVYAVHILLRDYVDI